MNKKIILLLAVVILTSSIGFCATKSTKSSSSTDKIEITPEDIAKYYPNANINSVISKYKSKNYAGCLQEAIALTYKNPENSAGYYYMALAYSHMGKKAEAGEAYDKVIELSPDSQIASYAEKGKACIDDETKCAGYVSENKDKEVSEDEALDKFINAPYGNGLSPELNKELKQKKLNNFKDSINSNDNLQLEEINKIRKFDIQNKSDAEDDTIKIAQVSDEEVLKAINTLKDAGLTISVSDGSTAQPQPQPFYPNGYQDPEMAQLSMMLGNNNNQGSMANMLPYLMYQSQQEGKNMDPQMIQAMMMNSMMTDFTFSNNDNNR